MGSVDLINDLLHRSEGSLDQLKLHYGPLIRYIIAPILQDQRDRDECFNDVLFRVWNRIDQFNLEQGNWTKWLSTVARNAAIDRARKRSQPSEELNEEIPDTDANPEQELLRKQRQNALYKALNSLDTYEKALFYKKYYYRQSTTQIAAECGTTERAIEGRLYRVRKKLRKLLGGELYD